MITLERGPFPGEQVEVRTVAGDQDAILLLAEVQERPVGEAREPCVRRDGEHIVSERAKWIPDPRGREVRVEEQPHPAAFHPAASASYEPHSMNGYSATITMNRPRITTGIRMFSESV